MEENYTKIDNELMMALISSGLNGTEMSVFLFIYRKTVGWNKTQDMISHSQFLEHIPVSKVSIIKALDNLQLVKILKLVKKGISVGSANVWELEQDFTKWQLVKKTKLVKKTLKTSKLFDKKLVKKTLHTKDNIQKTNTKEKVDYEYFTNLWNRFADKYNKKKVIKMNETRKVKLKKRCNETKDFNGVFLQVLKVASKSDFLLDNNFFSFEWVIANDNNYIKVLEGKYNE